jgi:hypothetical protein
MSTSEPDITAEVHYVTPADAAEWLSHNQRNRRINKKLVSRLARAMTEDRWRLTGEAIKFDKQGKLLDGQHRLLAIQQSAVAVEMMIIRGLESETQDVMDTGKVRGAGDVISIHGVGQGNYSAIAAAARVLIAYREGVLPMGPGQIPVENDQVLKCVLDHPIIGDLQPQAMRINRATSIPPAALLASMVIIHESDPEDDHTSHFFNRLESGAELPANSPILLLRNRFIVAKQQRERLSAYMTMSAVMRMYVAYRDGDSPAKLPLIGRDGRSVLIPVL